MRLRGMRIRHVTSVLLLCLTGFGCATSKKQQPLSAPAAELTTWHYAGDPISGPSGAKLAAAPIEQALGVHVRWVALARMPTTSGLAPLSSDARLIAAGRGVTPVLSSGQLTRAARVASGENVAAVVASLDGNKLGPAAIIGEADGALPPGVTVVFEAADPHPVLDPILQGPITRRLTVAVHRAAGAGPATVPAAEQVEIAVSVVDLAQGADQGARLQREFARLEPVAMRDGAECIVAIPFRFDGDATVDADARAGNVVVVIDVIPSDDSPVHRDAYARSVADLTRGTAPAEATLAAWRPRANWSSLDAALAGIVVRPRPALAQSASESGATLCGEVALVADDATVAQLARRIRASLPPPTTQPREAVGWAMDTTCLELMGELESANKLPPELATVLTAHAGETGRSAGALAELARTVGSAAEFNQRLAAENFIDLEDNSPAARVRAYDWLQSRKLAPAGYDPLAPPKERRAALDKAAEPAPAAGADPGAPATQPTADTK